MEKDVRTRLIEEAAPLFAKKGFAAVSVRELAQAADANVAAISYYFSGKEGLYLAVLEHTFAPIVELLREGATLGPVAASDRLTMYARGVSKVHRERPYLIRIMHMELINPTSGFESVVKKTIGGVFGFLRQTIADGITAGEFDPTLNIDHAVIALAGTLNFYFIARPLAQSLIPLSPTGDQDFLEQAFRIYLKGIRRDSHE